MPTLEIDRPSSIPTQIYIGDRSTHHTHALSVFRGIVYCARCGVVAVTKQVLLLAPCEGRLLGKPGYYGRSNIDRLGQGLVPYGVRGGWPIHPADTGLSQDLSDVETGVVASFLWQLKAVRGDMLANARGVLHSAAQKATFVEPQVVHVSSQQTGESDGSSSD